MQSCFQVKLQWLADRRHLNDVSHRPVYNVDRTGHLTNVLR